MRFVPLRGWIRNAGAVALGVILLLGPPRPTVAAEDLGLKVPPGFEVTLYSDETLANDIYAMTLDSKGRVVVTTRGDVKILHDSTGRGKADRATVFAETATGGMGLCFDGNDLLFCGDGWLSRYRDADGDGRADGPPEKIIPLAFTEHGGHAMRKGPDGYWYVIGGNDAKIGKDHAASPRSPIRNPEAGALLRLPPNLDPRGCEVIAQGFRNPYDFDFNALGDIFTYDSDVERDAFLPWYSPTRAYHVAYAGHHGWRLNGFMRSWARKSDYLDTVDILEPLGRGSPTGVTCYRHDLFPEHYRGGVFLLDWTFGKVFFLPLKRDGASFSTAAEVFIEPTGTHGFAPTDVVVAPDGALLISIGGRKTRGAVYRIAYQGKDSASDSRKGEITELVSVLEAPQPLDAWSRARWEPLARKLGPEPFRNAILDKEIEPSSKIRAIEILTELFGGLPESIARPDLFNLAQPDVQARIAWSLGRVPCPNFGAILVRLANEPYDFVRVAALDALADHADELPADVLRVALAPNLDQPGKRVRQAAARLASKLPESAWKSLQQELKSSLWPPEVLAGALASVWRHPEVGVHTEVAEVATRWLNFFPVATLDSLRLIMLAFGDYHLINPMVEVDTGYSLAQPLTGHEELTARIREAVRDPEVFPSRSDRVNEEAARLLAMLEDDDPATPAKIAAFWTDESPPTRDMHYLIVYSRLRGPLGGALTPRVASTILALDRKLQGQEQRNKQSWNDRLSEVVARLLKRIPGLDKALLESPDLVGPNHVALALALPKESREKAARKFLDAVRKDDDFTWSGSFIDLLATLPPEEVRPVFRARWENFGLRDALLLQLASEPDSLDRDKFLTALDSAQPQVIRAALGALERLPRDESAANLVPLLRLLRRLGLEPTEAATRARVLALIARQSGESFAIAESSTDAASLRRVYSPVFSWFEQAHPAEARAIQGGAEEDLSAWAKRLKEIDWTQGDAARGARLFESRACQTCHAGPRALGPELSGVASRFSREDLFNAIVAPSLDVSPLYRTTLVETRDGEVYSGMVAFESADGVILQTGATTTIRLAGPDIATRLPGSRSLMPTGLLKDLKDGDLADLYAYLLTLSPRPKN